MVMAAVAVGKAAEAEVVGLAAEAEVVGLAAEEEVEVGQAVEAEAMAAVVVHPKSSK